MYKIKQIPEDFYVKELIKLNLSASGRFLYCLLKKKNMTTEDALRKVCFKLKMPRNKINYAGNKDKHAVTEQHISIEHSLAKPFAENDISLEILGKGNQPISLGSNKGNYFEIIVRNLDNEDIFLIKKNLLRLKTSEFHHSVNEGQGGILSVIKNHRDQRGDDKIMPPVHSPVVFDKNRMKFLNIFDEQRFSRHNDEIGELIVREKFKEAISLILQGTGREESIIESFIRKRPNDYIGALRSIPKKILMIYIHAFQSRMWNDIAEKSRQNKKNIDIPILGFASELKGKKIIEEYCNIMKMKGIGKRSFIIRKIPRLSSEGSKRKLFAKISNFRISKEEKDELNKGKLNIKISFSLPKGSYATIAVKELFTQNKTDAP